jgi:hypothetical protein
VSFERDHRIAYYPAAFPDRPVLPVLEKAKIFDSATPDNGGPEALTTLANGRLLALEEGESLYEASSRGWLQQADGRWARFTYRTDPWFQAVGAATLANGDVLILERLFSFLGFRTRVVLVRHEDLVPGAIVRGQEVLRSDGSFPAEDYEGIAVLPDSQGGHDVYLISDNNFNPLFRTVLLLFALPPAPADRNGPLVREAPSSNRKERKPG